MELGDVLEINIYLEGRRCKTSGGGRKTVEKYKTWISRGKAFWESSHCFIQSFLNLFLNFNMLFQWNTGNSELTGCSYTAYVLTIGNAAFPQSSSQYLIFYIGTAKRTSRHPYIKKRHTGNGVGYFTLFFKPKLCREFSFLRFYKWCQKIKRRKVLNLYADNIGCDSCGYNFYWKTDLRLRSAKYEVPNWQIMIIFSYSYYLQAQQEELVSIAKTYNLQSVKMDLKMNFHLKQHEEEDWPLSQKCPDTLMAHKMVDTAWRKTTGLSDWLMLNLTFLWLVDIRP